MTAIAIDGGWTYVRGRAVTRDVRTPVAAISDLSWLLHWATQHGTSVVIPNDPLGKGRHHLVNTINLCPGWDAQPTEGAWVAATRRKGTLRISIGVREWMDPEDPLLPADLTTVEVATRLFWWEALLGTRYHHNPGAAALLNLRATPNFRVRWRLQNPATAEWWQPPGNIPEWRWTAPKKGLQGRQMHRWDMRSAYLAAAAAATLPRRQLAHTGADVDPFDSVGYYRVIIAKSRPELEVLNRVVRPARDGSRWVTSGLLAGMDISAGEVEVIDSWTVPLYANDSGRLLRPWAERIRNAMSQAGATVPADVRHAFKLGYSHAIGLMAVPRGSVYRPDWRHLIIGQQQGSMLRRIMRVHQLLGIWPVKIDVDCVWYDTDRPDQVGEALGVGDLIGRMRYEGTETL